MTPDVSSEQYHALDDPISDKMLGLILALGSEVWVLRDRLALLEAALEEQCSGFTDQTEQLSASDEYLALMQSDRKAFMARFLRSILDDGTGEPLWKVERGQVV
jgi:hypothetical protein